MKDKNHVMYLVTIIVVIIVYLVIYLFGATIRKNIYMENEGYENDLPKQPVNNILSYEKTSILDPITVIYEYDENNYIDLYNQFPTADEVGMNFVGDKYTHDFKLKLSRNSAGVAYVITAKKQPTSTLENQWAKLYLVSDGNAVGNCFRDNGRVKTYDDYMSYLLNPNEKILHQGIITYEEAKRGYKDFTFRMWISEDLKVYNEDYLEKAFQVKITVYAGRL